MSSRARKLGKRIGLKREPPSDAPKHGCIECRSLEFRSQITRELFMNNLTASPPTLVCPACSASWTVRFGADASGQMTVSFTAAVLS